MKQEEERGGLITELREQRLWTREKLAKEAGVSPTTIAQAEEGRTHIRLATIGKLATALEVDPQELLHPKKAAASPSPVPAEASGERRFEPADFMRAAESLSQFCDYWDQALEAGELDQRSLDDFRITAEGFVPVLMVALDAERRLTDEAVLEKIIYDRFIIFATLMERERSDALAESEKESAIVQLRDYVRKAG